MEHTLRQLARAPEVVRKHASVVVGLTTIRIAQRARVFAPESTGLLKREILADHKDGKLTGFVGVSESAFYWRFHEYGTVKMPARPFFRPAAEEGQQPFAQEMRQIGPAVEHEMSSR